MMLSSATGSTTGFEDSILKVMPNNSQTSHSILSRTNRSSNNGELAIVEEMFSKLNMQPNSTFYEHFLVKTLHPLFHNLIPSLNRSRSN